MMAMMADTVVTNWALSRPAAPEGRRQASVEIASGRVRCFDDARAWLR
jgi:hypothetical protein